MINSGFYTMLLGDLDLEGMAIEINYDNYILASINYEKGINDMEIELFISEESPKKFNLHDYIAILEKARNLALKCAKEDELMKSSECISDQP